MLQIKVLWKEMLILDIVLTETTVAQNEDAFSYLRVCGLYFLAVVFVATIVIFIIHRDDVNV